MIDPTEITTKRVGELPSAGFNLTDKIPHEIGTVLNQGTIQQLIDFISGYLGTVSGLAFNPTTVADGGTLPETTVNEWILVGKGTFHNVGGEPDIVTTEELNALTSNGSFWSLAVQIPINVELAGIVQTIRSGYLATTPSEDAVFRALLLKANTADIVSPSPIEFIDFPELVSPENNFDIPVEKTAIWATVNGGMYYLETLNNTSKENLFTQLGNTVTFKTELQINNYVIIFYQ